MKRTGKGAAMKLRDFLKAGVAADTGVSLEGAGEILKGADSRKDKV
jgi:hypothetical protein